MQVMLLGQQPPPLAKGGMPILRTGKLGNLWQFYSSLSLLMLPVSWSLSAYILTGCWVTLLFPFPRFMEVGSTYTYWSPPWEPEIVPGQLYPSGIFFVVQFTLGFLFFRGHLSQIFAGPLLENLPSTCPMKVVLPLALLFQEVLDFVILPHAQGYLSPLFGFAPLSLKWLSIPLGILAPSPFDSFHPSLSPARFLLIVIVKQLSIICQR